MTSCTYVIVQNCHLHYHPSHPPQHDLLHLPLPLATKTLIFVSMICFNENLDINTCHTEPVVPEGNSPSHDSPEAQELANPEEASTHAPIFSSDFPTQDPPPLLNENQPNNQIQERPLELQDFRLLRTLGTGSFGRVHLVNSKHNDRYYAIKVLRKEDVVRLKQVAHTKNERNVLMQVSHPFIVNLWGTFQDDVNLYMVMDYVPGGELFSYLRRSKRFSNAVAKFYAAEVFLVIV